MTNQILAEVAKNPGLTNVDTDLGLNKPELSVTVNRDKSSDTGVQVETVGRTLETMLGGRQVTRFKQNGEQYDVIVQIADARRTKPSDIRDIFVRAKDGSMIPLANLITVDETVSPRELNHFGQRPGGDHHRQPGAGVCLGRGADFHGSGGGQGIETRLRGRLCRPVTRIPDLQRLALALTFVLALAFIYLVLAAQFEKFHATDSSSCSPCRCR